MIYQICNGKGNYIHGMCSNDEDDGPSLEFVALILP